MARRIPGLMIIFPLFLTGALMAGSDTTDMQCHWAAEPVQADGDMGEWIETPTVYIEDPGVLLGLSNNQENLYILFRFKDDRWAQVIRLNGLTLWLDSAGKKKKELSVRYNGGPPLGESHLLGENGSGDYRERMSRDEQELFAERLEAFAGPADQITVKDKKKGLEFSGPAKDTGGSCAAFEALPDTFTYEFSIPLVLKDDGDIFLNAQPGQTIYLGFEWGMDKDDFERMREETGSSRGTGSGDRPDGFPGGIGMGGAGTGGGGMFGGGMGGRGGPGRDGHMRPPEKEEIWIRVLLAPAPKD